MSLLKDIGASLAGAASAGIAIGKEKLGPAIEEGSKAVFTFGKDKVVPAMGEAVNVANDFGKEQFLPAMAGAVQAANSFAQALGPAAAGAAVALSPLVGDLGKTVEGSMGQAMTEAGKFAEEKFKPAIEKGGNYVKNNPGTAAMVAASVLSFAAPGIVSGPVLWVFGWGSNGVRAGSIAAGIQASSGSIAAGSTFATLQSAAMGGAAPVVKGVVMGWSAVSGTVGSLWGYRNATQGAV